MVCFLMTVVASRTRCVHARCGSRRETRHVHERSSIVKSLNGEQLLEALTATAAQPASIAVWGFAKAGEEGHIAFSLHGRCTVWVPIPVALIRDATLRGRRRCGDHVHDVVTFELHPPATAEGRALAGLLDAALVAVQSGELEYRRLTLQQLQELPDDPWNDEGRYPIDFGAGGGGGGGAVGGGGIPGRTPGSQSCLGRCRQTLNEALSRCGSDDRCRAGVYAVFGRCAARCLGAAPTNWQGLE